MEVKVTQIWQDCAQTTSHERTQISEIEEKRRSEFLKIHEVPEWAKAKKLSEDDELDAIALGRHAVIKQRRRELKINYLCGTSPHEAAGRQCHVLKFCAGNNVLCTAGHKTVKLYKFQNKEITLSSEVGLPSSPIRCAELIRSRHQLLLCSPSRKLFCLNLEAQSAHEVYITRGSKGDAIDRMTISADDQLMALFSRRKKGRKVELLSSKSGQRVATLTHGLPVIDVAFCKVDPRRLYSLGENGLLSIWDVRSSRCIKLFSHALIDKDSVAAAPNGAYLAFGGSAGIVALYACARLNGPATNDPFHTSSVEPLKEFGNITTPISSLQFNDARNLLCFSSVATRKGIRMVDLEDLTVIQNWPVYRKHSGHLSRISAFDMDETGAHIAMAVGSGNVVIHRIEPTP